MEQRRVLVVHTSGQLYGVGTPAPPATASQRVRSAWQSGQQYPFHSGAYRDMLAAGVSRDRRLILRSPEPLI